MNPPRNFRLPVRRILCMARLGLRASEVVQLRLEDLDWRNAVVRVRARKTGHGALLPLTAQVGTALAGYNAAHINGVLFNVNLNGGRTLCR
jgi:integrase